MKHYCGFLPGFLQDEVEWKSLCFSAHGKTAELLVPHLTSDQLLQVIQTVQTRREQYMDQLSVYEIVDRIDQTVQRLLIQEDPIRRKLEEWIPVITGYDPEMVRLGITTFFKTFRKPQLLRFLEEDFSNPTLLDEWRPRIKGGFTRAYGPSLLVHVWAGNVPGLPLWSLISGLLVKSASIGKVASAEPLFASLFLQALAETDPELAGCCAIIWWKGGDAETEQLLFGQAEVVLGYGSNDTLESIRSRVPVTARFLGYGHKISFALIGKEALDARRSASAAHLAAYDIMRYDQQGCYSPQMVFVEEGGRVSPLEFAQLLAHELDCFQHKYPRRPLSLEEAADYKQFQQASELESIKDPKTSVLAEPSLNWTVVFQETASFLPTPTHRSVRVMAVNELSEILPLLDRVKPYLQTAAIAVEPKRLYPLSDALGKKGVTRISALGHATAPEAGWHHDGRLNLADLVRFIDMEASAELEAEKLAPYHESCL